MGLAQKLIGCAILAGCMSAAAVAERFAVEAGKTEPLRLRGKAASVAIGNPSIADVAVHNDQLLLVSGKSFGSTNLLIFDAQGRMLYSADIVVTNNATTGVRVNRAGVDRTYDCAETCQQRPAS